MLVQGVWGWALDREWCKLEVILDRSERGVRVPIVGSPLRLGAEGWEDRVRDGNLGRRYGGPPPLR